MKVIVIEDNSDHFDIIEDAFSDITEIHTQVVRANTLLAGTELLLSEHFDICLCDLQLPDSTIDETIEWLCSQTNPLPIITLTSLNSIEIAQTLLNKGVQDYLYKGELTPQLLYKTCKYAIERFIHQDEIARYNQDMQMFCASLSHDFNGHISRIMGVSKALKSDLMKRTSCTPNELQWFDYLEKSTTEVHSLVTDLQSYLSVGYANHVFENVSLKSVLAKVVSFLENAFQMDFEINMPKELTTISGNTGLLQLLFQNLLANSIKFNKRRPIINIYTKGNGNYVEIILQDNGIGFDPIHAKNIFSPFNRLANGKEFSGSGLGLSIVKRITEHHNGSIEAHSQLGVGSSFTLNLKKG